MEQSLRLRADGISKRYGAAAALSAANFELRPGEIMALLGENGAGKSTMVKILSGLVTPDEGEIRIDGRVVDISSPGASQAAGIAVVQQEYSTVGTMTVGENLLLGRRDAPWWWSPRRLAEWRAVLDRVGLGGIDPDRRVSTLTVAEQQLLEIARVLNRDARIIVFDEPTAALSDAEVTRVLDTVRRLAAEGRSIVYVTHRLAEVFEIADRVTIFRNGASSAPIEASELDVDKVVRLMIGRELGHLYPPRAERWGEDVLVVRDLVAPGLRAPGSLTVRAGEIVGLTGQLGSGVSEYLRGIAGISPRLSGTVELGGAPVPAGRRAGIRRGIAYCSPDRKLDGIFAAASVRHNLSSPWIGRVSVAGVLASRRERASARSAAERFAVDPRRLPSRVGQLSGGNQQKVAVGKWLGISPRVLIVEEPTRGVDVGARADIYRTLRTLADGGVAIVVGSTDSNEVFGLCDTIATFYRGRLTESKAAQDWSEHDLVREVMHREEALS